MKKFLLFIFLFTPCAFAMGPQDDFDRPFKKIMASFPAVNRAYEEASNGNIDAINKEYEKKPEKGCEKNAVEQFAEKVKEILCKELAPAPCKAFVQALVQKFTNQGRSELERLESQSLETSVKFFAENLVFMPLDSAWTAYFSIQRSVLDAKKVYESCWLSFKKAAEVKQEKIASIKKAVAQLKPDNCSPVEYSEISAVISNFLEATRTPCSARETNLFPIWVFGGPGVGKSHWTKKVYESICKEDAFYGHKEVCADPDVSDHLKQALHRMLQNGKSGGVLLLDGLDEALDNSETIRILNQQKFLSFDGMDIALRPVLLIIVDPCVPVNHAVASLFTKLNLFFLNPVQCEKFVDNKLASKIPEKLDKNKEMERVRAVSQYARSYNYRGVNGLITRNLCINDYRSLERFTDAVLYEWEQGNSLVDCWPLPQKRPQSCTPSMYN